MSPDRRREPSEDEHRAALLARARAAARAGDPAARFRLFVALWAGEASAAEGREAVDALMAAVEDGFGPALTMLGRLLLFEPHPDLGLAADPEVGREALAAAVAACDPEARFWLGRMHAEGVGGPADAAEAVRWYESAARIADLPAAHYALWEHYRDGEGVEADPIMAAAHLRTAAEHGDVDAMYGWGLGHTAGAAARVAELGLPIPHDPREAVRWLAAAAEAGHEKAAAVLAELLDGGAGDRTERRVPRAPDVASPPEGGSPMAPQHPRDGGSDPTPGAPDPALAAKRLDVALELTKLWLGETSWYAPGSVYEQAAIIGRVFEAYRRQLDEGRPVDPTTVFDPQDNHPAAIGPLEWPAWEDQDEDEDDEDEDEDE